MGKMKSLERRCYLPKVTYLVVGWCGWDLPDPLGLEFSALSSVRVGCGSVISLCACLCVRTLGGCDGIRSRGLQGGVWIARDPGPEIFTLW